MLYSNMWIGAFFRYGVGYSSHHKCAKRKLGKRTSELSLKSKVASLERGISIDFPFYCKERVALLVVGRNDVFPCWKQLGYILGNCKCVERLEKFSVNVLEPYSV